jgi:hypothetical protein
MIMNLYKLSRSSNLGTINCFLKFEWALYQYSNVAEYMNT